MAKCPKMPKGATSWGQEDRTPAALRRQTPAPSGLVFPPEVFLSDERAQYWLKLDGWTVREVALLWCGLDPILLEKWASFMGKTVDDLSPIAVEPRAHALGAAHAAATLVFPAAPSAVLQWAASKGWPFPAVLSSSFIPKPAGEKVPSSQSTVHSSAAQRINLLTPVIDEAIRNLNGADSTAVVWAELEAMATAGKAPFVGAADGDLKYLDGGQVKVLTRQNLRGRLGRRRSSSR